MRVSVLLAAVGLWAALGGQASADDILVSFEGSSASQTIGVLKAADTLSIIGHIKRPDSAIDNTVKFNPRASSLAVSLSWRLGIAGDAIRLTGVNLDLLDGSGAVVASDTFQGAIGGFAASTMTASVVSGRPYRLRLTGASAGVAAYTIVVAPGP